jgi:hypothetical protein
MKKTKGLQWLVVVALVIHVVFAMVYTFLYNFAYTLETNETKSVDYIRDYFDQRVNKPVLTSHNVWTNTLPADVQEHIDTIAADIRKQIRKTYKSQNIVYLPQLTEISITGKTKENSEKVFFTRHFDGPFYFIPCKIDRVILAISGNSKVQTVFPNKSINLKTYQAMMFDYDRTSHYITSLENNHTPEHSTLRIILKLQYYINPKNYIHDKCIKSHTYWAVKSRDNLENTKAASDLKTTVGIIATYISTHMLLLAVFLLVTYIFYIHSKSSYTQRISLVLFCILLTFVLVYHTITLYSILVF